MININQCENNEVREFNTNHYNLLFKREKDLFKDLFRKLGFDELHKMQQHILQECPEETFFRNIIGNKDIKKLLMRAKLQKME